MDELIPDTYTVTVVITPSGYVLTSDLGSNESDLGMDFGFKAPTGFKVLDLQAELEGDAVRVRWSVQSSGWWDGEFKVQHLPLPWPTPRVSGGER